MKNKKFFIAFILIFLVLIVHYTNGFKNKGNIIVIEKQVGKENTYDDFNEIRDSKEVQKLKDLLASITWIRTKVSMEHPANYKFHFDYINEEHRPNGLVYALWISPSKDKIEIIMENKPRYAQLDKEKSAELFEIIAGNKLANANIQLPDAKPKDFNFIFNFGVGSKNQLDTFKGQFAKDMVEPGEPPATADLRLTEDEMNIIYSEMKKINILSYPNNFTPKGTEECTPVFTFAIKIVVNGVEKTIHWENIRGSDTKTAIQLKAFFNKIFEMIINKEEFKKLPPAKGTYS